MAEWPMRICPRVRWLCGVLVIAALAQGAPATAQQPGAGTTAQQPGTGTTVQQPGTGTTAQEPGTGTTGTDDGTAAEPFRVSIDAPPEGSAIPPSGDISFSANLPGARFTCRVGAAAAGPCTSPVHYGPLQPGQQLPFAVSALLPGAHTTSADETVYTIAQVAPSPLEVTITSAPSGKVEQTVATISFAANRSNAGFSCTLDGVAARCSSPKRYRDLSAGTHVFSVVAVAGKETSKAKRASWTVATAVPAPQRPPRAVITSAPEGTVVSRKARLAFTATPAASRFQCSLDGSALVACHSPRTYSHLSRSSHTFAVRALGAGGTPGPAALARWTVRPTSLPPQVTPPPPTAEEGGSTWLLAVLAAFAAAGILLESVRRIGRARRRATWQLDARPEPPERPCSKRNHYCQKTQVKLKPGSRRIAYLVVEARDNGHAQLETQIAGRLVSQLNGALRDHKRNQDRDALRTTLVPVAGLLVREIEVWLGDDAVHHDVAVDAHLIAAEAEYEFALYCCKNRDGGPEWEKEDEWTASVEDESEENAVRLDRAEPLDARVESATDQLTDFLMELDKPTSVRASTEGSLTL
jgi:hypothetical protein